MMGISGDAATGEHPMLDPLNVQVSIPMGRLGVPSDISNAVCFLASDESRFVTGLQFKVDAGAMLKF